MGVDTIYNAAFLMTIRDESNGSLMMWSAKFKEVDLSPIRRPPVGIHSADISFRLLPTRV